MEKIIRKSILLLMLLPFMVAACGNDDDSSTSSGNANANGTDKSPYETRIEVPAVHKGNNYLFLVKSTADYGVNYIVEWDCVNHAQRWTCWEWNSTNAVKGWQRAYWSSGYTFNGYGGTGDPFQPDTDIPADYRSELSDYQGSGYNRGHMCASEDRICSKDVNGQTYYLSNMHPQIYEFNSAVWANMESKVRTWRDNTIRNGGTMYICKGGTIYDVTLNGTTQTGIKGHIGTHNLPIPKYFFMAVLIKTAAGGYTAMAFWAEHKADNSTNLTPYMITVDELEQRTGYDFFCNLPDKVENTVESILTTSEWK